MKEQQSKHILSIDYQHQLSKQIREQVRQRMVLIQAQWFTLNNVVSHKVNCSTGFLISPTLILTAAHNIYNKTTQKFANRLSLYFLHQEQRQTISVFSQKMIMDLTQDDYRCQVVTKNGKTTYGQDYAVVKIGKRQEKIKNEELFLRFQNNAEIDKGTTIFLAGFPDFTLKQSKKFKQKMKHLVTKQTLSCLKEDSGVLQNLQNNALYYHITTIGGQSGSPLFIKDTTKEGLRIVGVHNSYNSQKQMGKGIFFNGQNLATLQRWIDELSDQLNEDRITRMVKSELKYFGKYSKELANTLDKLITNNASLLGSKFCQTQENWQSFWQQFTTFKRQMEGIYALSSRYYANYENNQSQNFHSQNSSIRLNQKKWLQDYFEQQQQAMYENGQHCTGHRKEPAYYRSCNNDKQDQDKFTCNRCVFFRKVIKVRCLLHDEQIKYVEIDSQSGNIAILQERQIYLCKTCMKDPKNRDGLLRYQRIDSHYRPIGYVRLISSERISSTSEADLENLLLSDVCAVEKYSASELLEQNIVEIKEGEFRKFMFSQSQENADIEKCLAQIQRKLVQFNLDQQKQYGEYYQKISTYFQAFSDSLHCRSKQLKQQLLNHRSDDQQCLKILQKLSIMRLHRFNLQQPSKLSAFLRQCIQHLDSNLTEIALLKSQVISKLDKDIQSFIFHGGTKHP